MYTFHSCSNRLDWDDFPLKQSRRSGNGVIDRRSMFAAHFGDGITPYIRWYGCLRSRPVEIDTWSRMGSAAGACFLVVGFKVGSFAAAGRCYRFVRTTSWQSAGKEHIGMRKLRKTHLHRVCGDGLDIWSALSWSTNTGPCSLFQIDHRGERRLQGTSTHLLISWHFTLSRCRRAAPLIPRPPQRTTLGLLMPTRQQAAEHLPKHRSEPRLPGTARQTNSRDGTKRRGIRRRTSTGDFAIRTSRRLAQW